MARSFIPVVFASLVLALTGCMADPADDEAPTPPAITGPVFQNGMSAPTQNVLRDCYESVGSFAVPAEQYVDRVPAGFRVAPYTAVGTLPLAAGHWTDGPVARATSGLAPPNPTAFTGELVAVASACQDASDTTVNRLGVFLMVDPPADLHNGSAAFGHLLILAYFTDSQAHADVMEAWGFGYVLHVGPVTTNVDEDPVMRASDTEGSVDPFAARLDTVVAGAPAPMEGSAARFFATDANGTLAGVADASFGGSESMPGQATLTGSTDAGIWRLGVDQNGVGLQAWGHTNTWDHVSMDDPDEASDTDAFDP